jgi:hypothetical protein
MIKLCADFWNMATAMGTLLLAGATFLTVRAIHTQMRYDRLVKEMENLVAPLRSKMGDPYIFEKGTPASILPHFEYYRDFWNTILLNRYLGVSYLRDAIETYIIDKSNDDKYKTGKEALFSAIRTRYSELTKEIDRIEAKSWWQFWK